MGYFTPTSARGSKYLITAGNSPYCGHPHLTEVGCSFRFEILIFIFI